MKPIILFVLFALAFCSDYAKEDNVIILTDDNFDEAVKEFNFLLVKFYAPWCGHCKKLAPEFSRAAAVLEKENIILAKVDATVQKKLGEKYEIKGYPTLKFFSHGSDMEYNGGRTEQEIIAWLRKKTGPLVKILNTVEEVEAFKSENKVSVTYFGDNKEEKEAFEAIAQNYDDIVFGVSSVKEVIAKYVTKGKVVLFKAFDEMRNDYEGEIKKDEIIAFISQHSTPLVMDFDENCAQTIFGKNKPGLFLYLDKKSNKAEEYKKLITGIAEKIKGKLQVVYTGITDSFEQRLAEYIGVTASDLPTVRIHDTRVDLKKYIMKGEINEANILKFVEDWEHNKLSAHLKSQEIPEKQTDPVYQIVGKSFKDVVINSDKDVLIKFYAPWCGHCKKLAPIYEELAAKYKSNDKLIIAEVDSTENEIEEVAVNGFPTLKFWPSGKKDHPIDFEGDRTLEGFEKFLAQHCTHKFEIIEKAEGAKEEVKEEVKEEKKDDL